MRYCNYLHSLFALMISIYFDFVPIKLTLNSVIYIWNISIPHHIILDAIYFQKFFNFFKYFISFSSAVWKIFKKTCTHNKILKEMLISHTSAWLWVPVVYTKYHQYNKCTIIHTIPNSLHLSILKQIIFISNIL